MLNRFYRLFGCVEDHALECGSVSTNLIPTVKKEDVNIECSSPIADSTEVPKDNTNIIKFVTLLNRSGYEVQKPRSKPILISPSRSILKNSVQAEPGTPIPKIIYEEDNELSPVDEDFFACEGAAMSSPIRTITWGDNQYFESENRDLRPKVR